MFAVMRRMPHNVAITAGRRLMLNMALSSCYINYSDNEHVV